MSSVGMNLAPVNYYATEFPFIDRMKTGNGWGSSTGTVPVDVHGNPTAIPAGASFVQTLVALDPSAAPMTEVYELTYAGTASFEIPGATTLSSQPGKLVFSFANSTTTMANVVARNLNAGDPLHDVHLVRQDQVDAFNHGQVFNPDFLAQVSNWQTLRFMDWESINNTTITSWDQRTHVDDASWAGNGNSSGVPIEVMIRLANEAKTDLWFNVPTQADDTYVRNALQLIKDMLAPGLKVHVEYSNEVWNAGFQQSAYAQKMANQLWGKDANHDGVINPNDSAEAVARGNDVYYGYRTAQIAAIANSVFSGADDPRLEMVFATQNGNASIEPYLLDGIARANVGSVGALFDEWSVASYFGLEFSGYSAADQAKVVGWAKSGQAGLDAAFQELAHGGAGMSIAYSIDDVAKYLAYEKTVADRYGLDLVGYEGGFSGSAQGYGTNQATIQDFFARLMADPRMEDLYKYWFDAFSAAGGEMLAAFDDVQAPSVHGTFGTLASLYDAKTPRYDALLAEAGSKTVVAPATPPSTADTTLKTAQANVVLDAAHKDLTFIGTGDFVGTGNAQDNIITGGAGADKLNGASGNDTLIGGAGNDLLDGGVGADRMVGGAGNDSYFVNHAGDVVVEQAGEGTDTVTTSINLTLAANVENLTLAAGATTVHGNEMGNIIREYLGGTGTYSLFGEGGNDQILGSDAIDMIYGGAGNDQLTGGGGNDVLNGGTGADWLSGGRGADRFVFAPGDSGVGTAADMIADFSHAEGDKIDLTAFDANPATAVHDPLHFIGTASFTHHAGELRSVGHDIQIDLNGDGVADFALYNAGGAVTANDFLL